MFGFFTWIANAFQQLVGWFFTLITNVFLALWTFVKDVPSWVLDQSMGLATDVLNSLGGDYSQFSVAQYITGFPTEVTNMMSLLHLGPCLAMIVAALVIRFAIQTIPFVRWGS